MQQCSAMFGHVTRLPDDAVTMLHQVTLTYLIRPASANQPRMTKWTDQLHRHDFANL